MEHYMDLRNAEKKHIVPISDKFGGKDSVHNKELSFTNYYMEINGKPFMGISGECHYSRVHQEQWEDTILKMKMAGINIISTYIFWIHHEEKEGFFRFDGNRNVRKFIQLCAKHGMYVIVRIGPFDHGEVRNGGIPDWMYGKPFECRCTSEGFLHYTRILYRKLAKQFEGLYFKDGSPIIGTQIDNEYMHSAAPWELTSGSSNEWISGGTEGNVYMLALKKIAQEEGIVTPFYTCTGWGGAAAPAEDMLPLWGGYAFWPWIYYDYKGEHPATPEYIYRDNHNSAVTKTYNYDPTYEPESLPYACCEMGGGMACYYQYRFKLPFESVDAMANIKLASGCNFLGYYMFCGGSNPKGERTLFLNEGQCPKISYDYQAPIGEYGQVRPSYHRLRVLHTFMTNFSEQLCPLKTILPEGSQEIDPKDVDTLRYAVRTDGKSGFLFLNNFQDHVECKDKKSEKIVLALADREVVFDNLSMKAGEEAILPFGMDVEGYQLICAKAQPLSVIRTAEKTVYFFFAPNGMEGEYVWDSKGVKMVDGKEPQADTISVKVSDDRMSSYILEGEHGAVEIVTLTRKQSLDFYNLDIEGKKCAVLCNSPFIYDGTKISLESPGEGAETNLLLYPGKEIAQIGNCVSVKTVTEGIWSGIKVDWDKQKLESVAIETKQTGSARFTIKVPELTEEDKDVLLQISYKGDIGYLFEDGELLSDNFCNGDVWEIGLKEVLKTDRENLLTILITPLKADATVDVSSTMAGRTEQMKAAVAELYSVSLKTVKRASFILL